uniref:Slc39a-8 n=1 Tax=Schmidtea mediterranea TaxID=79327 RepID=A0A0H3YKI0_SCHMD|nr:slc39a-8 [Schmidtea mediterranea]
MDAKTLKFISIPIIFVVNFIIGTFPFILITKRIRKTNLRNPSEIQTNYVVSKPMKTFLTFANFFCGGVFLSTSLIGLYPGVNSKFNDILRKRSNIPEYPYAGLSLAIGFFLVWILEIFVHACIHAKTHSHHHGNSKQHNSDNNSIPLRAMSTDSPKQLLEEQLFKAKQSDKLLTIEDNNSDDKFLTSESVQVEIEPSIDEAHSHVPIKGNLLGSVMLTFALGSHSIIEGLGFAMIGEFNLTVNMLITVLIHESVCALSLGVNLASKKTSVVTSISLLATFAALIPLGIGIGVAVNLGIEKNLVGDVVTAVLQGIAAGTFIYVVFMEILPAEMHNRKQAPLKVLMMVIGFSVIATMKIFHAHGDRQNMFLNCTSNFSTSLQKSPVHTH